MGVVCTVATPTRLEMKRREREVRLNYAKGKRGYVSVMREQYLRTDIPCKVKECTICDIDSKRSDWKGSVKLILKLRM